MSNIPNIYQRFNTKGIECDQCFDGEACWTVGKGERKEYLCQECKDFEIQSEVTLSQRKEVMNWSLQKFLSGFKSSLLNI